MILRYATNLKLAKDLYAASKRKLTGNPYTKQLFTQDFKLSERAMKLAGVIEFIASVCLPQVSCIKISLA